MGLADLDGACVRFLEKGVAADLAILLNRGLNRSVKRNDQTGARSSQRAKQSEGLLARRRAIARALEEAQRLVLQGRVRGRRRVRLDEQLLHILDRIGNHRDERRHERCERPTTNTRVQGRAKKPKPEIEPVEELRVARGPVELNH